MSATTNTATSNIPSTDNNTEEKNINQEQKVESAGEEHKLQSKWCFWYNSRQNGEHNSNSGFLERLKNLGYIQSVEDFFKYYCHMKRPNDLPREIDLHFFRENEIPMWESSINGGCWIIKIKKNDNIDIMWQSLLFACIGEQFSDPVVIGVVLSLRPKERLIEVWIKDGRNEKLRYSISKKIKELLKLDTELTTLYYKEHLKSLKDGSTMKNAEGFKFIKLSKNKSGLHGKHSTSSPTHTDERKKSESEEAAKKNI